MTTRDISGLAVPNTRKRERQEKAVGLENVVYMREETGLCV
jgi:hypothetical protein